ncbi:dehydrin, partial [Trifolium medium]|nr:dehydrin [Trifolium medium]
TEYGHQQHGEKGMVDKIKEKIPGTGTGTGYGTGTTGHGTGTGTGTGYGTTGHDHHGDQQQHGEKKGIMDKIKEKLPGTGSC